jgi:hypothetical protein
MMEVVSTFKTSVSLYKTTRRNFPEEIVFRSDNYSFIIVALLVAPQSSRNPVINNG